MRAAISCFPDLTGLGGSIANLRVQKRDVVDDRSRESGLELSRIGFGIDVADSGLTIRLRRWVRGHLAAETPHRDSSGNVSHSRTIGLGRCCTRG
jgi:hypothetical protein